MFQEFDECNSNCYQEITLKRKDNAENVFDYFLKMSKNLTICNGNSKKIDFILKKLIGNAAIFLFNIDISNENGNNESMNKIKENLVDFEIISLENRDVCLISHFEDFKNIYVCKAIKDTSTNVYNMHNIEIILKTMESNG